MLLPRILAPRHSEGQKSFAGEQLWKVIVVATLPIIPDKTGVILCNDHLVKYHSTKTA